MRHDRRQIRFSFDGARAIHIDTGTAGIIGEVRTHVRLLTALRAFATITIVQWDDQVIGDGQPSRVAKALLQLFEDDMRSGDRSDRRSVLTLMNRFS